MVISGNIPNRSHGWCTSASDSRQVSDTANSCEPSKAFIPSSTNLQFDAFKYPIFMASTPTDIVLPIRLSVPPPCLFQNTMASDVSAPLNASGPTQRSSNGIVLRKHTRPASTSSCIHSVDKFSSKFSTLQKPHSRSAWIPETSSTEDYLRQEEGNVGFGNTLFDRVLSIFRGKSEINDTPAPATRNNTELLFPRMLNLEFSATEIPSLDPPDKPATVKRVQFKEHERTIISNGQQKSPLQASVSQISESEGKKKNSSTLNNSLAGLVESIYTSSNNQFTPDTLDYHKSSFSSSRKQAMGPLLVPIINTYYARLEKSLVDRCALSLSWTIDEKYPDDSNEGLCWFGAAISEEQHQRLGRYGKTVNRFPGMQELVRKRWLARILKNFKLFYPSDYDFVPDTLYLPEDLDIVRRSLSSKTPKMIVKKTNTLDPSGSSSSDTSHSDNLKCKQSKVFILKPDAGAQGIGLRLVNRIEDIPRDVLSGVGAYIMQKYISDPLLINQKKFDIRIYVLITSVIPELEAYISTEGLVRCCTELYKAPAPWNFNNIYMHLTNFSINKDNRMHFVHLDGQDAWCGGSLDIFCSVLDIHDASNSKRLLSDTMKQISEAGYNTSEIWCQIVTIVQKTVWAIQPFLALTYRYTFRDLSPSSHRCFQILGFDILLDRVGKAWLLEVNSNPSLRVSYSSDELKPPASQVGREISTSSTLNDAVREMLSGFHPAQEIPSRLDECVKHPLVKEALLIASQSLYKPTSYQFSEFKKTAKRHQPEIVGSPSAAHNVSITYPTEQKGYLTENSSLKPASTFIVGKKFPTYSRGITIDFEKSTPVDFSTEAYQENEWTKNTTFSNSAIREVQQNAEWQKYPKPPSPTCRLSESNERVCVDEVFQSLTPPVKKLDSLAYLSQHTKSTCTPPFQSSESRSDQPSKVSLLDSVTSDSSEDKVLTEPIQLSHKNPYPGPLKRDPSGDCSLVTSDCDIRKYLEPGVGAIGPELQLAHNKNANCSQCLTGDEKNSVSNTDHSSGEYSSGPSYGTTGSLEPLTLHNWMPITGVAQQRAKTEKPYLDGRGISKSLCWKFFDFSLRTSTRIQKRLKLLLLCRRLFERATGFPKYPLLSLSRWETFTEEAGLTRLIATVRVPCLTVGLSRRETRRTISISMKSPRTKEQCGVTAETQKRRRHVTLCKRPGTNNQTEAKQHEVKTCRLDNQLRSNTDTQGARLGVSDAAVSSSKTGRWLLDLPSKRYVTRALSWPDLRWLYYRPLYPTTNQQKHQAEIERNGGIGFWNFWELLLQINALYHIAIVANQAQNQCRRASLTSRTEEIVPPRLQPSLSIDPFSLHSEEVDRSSHVRETTASMNYRELKSTYDERDTCIRTLHEGKSSIASNTKGPQGRRSEANETRSQHRLQARLQLEACASKLLNWWPDTTAIVEKVLQLDPEGLGETFTNLCSQLFTNADNHHAHSNYTSIQNSGFLQTMNLSEFKNARPRPNKWQTATRSSSLGGHSINPLDHPKLPSCLSFPADNSIKIEKSIKDQTSVISCSGDRDRFPTSASSLKKEESLSTSTGE